MAKLPRKCSECSAFLPPDATARRKTCNQNCRSKRHRRLARQKSRAPSGREGHTARDPAMQQARYALDTDIAHEVMKEELRPVIREAMTEDAMRSLRDLVGLMPAVVQALAQDIQSPDDLTRREAIKIVTRYTLGHEKIVPKDNDPTAGMVVNLNIPRPAAPDTPAPEVVTPIDADSDDLRVCDTCGEPKLEDEFIGAALRCNGCVKKMQDRAAQFLTEGDG